MRKTNTCILICREINSFILVILIIILITSSSHIKIRLKALTLHSYPLRSQNH